MEESRKIIVIGAAVIGGFMAPFLILGILNWLNAGFIIEDIQFIFLLSICGGCLFTSFHLWSRVPKLSGQIKTLFKLTGITFVVICFGFLYFIIDFMLIWYGMNTIIDTLNAIVPPIIFNMFYIEGLKVTMPVESLLLFAIVIISLSFYLFPMERYAKQTFPWHTISVLCCDILIILMLLARYMPLNTLLFSIGTIGVILWVFYNFLFLFYLYFQVAIKSPKGAAMRKAAMMIAFGLLIFVFVWVAGWAIELGSVLLDALLQLSLGVLALTLFNVGFFLLRPK